jgi:hypothetical protein
MFKKLATRYGFSNYMTNVHIGVKVPRFDGKWEKKNIPERSRLEKEALFNIGFDATLVGSMDAALVSLICVVGYA